VVNKDWLDIDVLEDYLDGKLDAKTMNRLEREALEDPFVAEALAGLSASPKRALQSISLLQKQLKERVDQQKSIKKKSVVTWQRLSIGSAAAVLFITVGIVYWMKQVNYDKALNSSKKVDVVIAPKEEKDTVLSKTVIPEALSIPREEALVQLKKAKVVNTAPAEIVAQDKVAVTKLQLDDQIAQGRTSAFSATAIAMPNSYGSDIISGKVVDEETGNPMVGASVSVKDSKGVLKVVATADADGKFSFRKDESIADSTITISYISYGTKVLPVKTNEFIAITLKEAASNLNEQVIRGYVRTQQTTGSTITVRGKEVADVPVANVEQLLQGKVAGLNIQNSSVAPAMKGSKDLSRVANAQSHPVNGWDQYYMYITNNSKFRGEARLGKSVELNFSIDTAGLPQNIKVLKGISVKYNQEAIRLIKEGPRWLQPEPANGQISFKIDF
jgi:hypothetical protein